MAFTLPGGLIFWRNNLYHLCCVKINSVQHKIGRWHRALGIYLYKIDQHRLWFVCLVKARKYIFLTNVSSFKIYFQEIWNMSRGFTKNLMQRGISGSLQSSLNCIPIYLKNAFEFISCFFFFFHLVFYLCLFVTLLYFISIALIQDTVTCCHSDQ